ncbi:auxin-induced protein 22A-like [Lotus japonicus]|uniref:auxin-induced protein 22A-like n=1 Tax=Lotus japonicus TaxID=34305 RepID=UPI00258C0094|nr:auxin-induced protein 22A-like [Lotus japonicus]
MELQLGLSLLTNSPDAKDLFPCTHNNKRTFSQIVEDAAESTNTDPAMLPTLSLLPFTRINNDKEEDEEDAPVGWPPVNYRRKKLRSSINQNGMYVKVKMEGVGIARKVDLTMHRSFHSLKDTLMDMFGTQCDQQSKSYELAYQDREGDWLLAEDVPWRNFIQCAQRLKLLKTRV